MARGRYFGRGYAAKGSCAQSAQPLGPSYIEGSHPRFGEPALKVFLFPDPDKFAASFAGEFGCTEPEHFSGFVATISACEKLGLWLQALDVVRYMNRFAGILPDAISSLTSIVGHNDIFWNILDMLVIHVAAQGSFLHAAC